MLLSSMAMAVAMVFLVQLPFTGVFAKVHGLGQLFFIGCDRDGRIMW